MRKLVKVATYKCDGCGQVYHDDWGREALVHNDIWDSAYEDDWEEIDGKHYCPDCYEFDVEEIDGEYCCTNYRAKNK